MEPFCIRQTLIPGTTRLFADFLYHFDKVQPFYGSYFSDAAAWPEAAKAISYPVERRAQLVQALREQNGDSAALDKLGQPNTVAVVTGQQVGLFSGPAYTIYKALTAVKLASQLDAQEIPAVPVFWLATEDHDIAEVNHTWVFDEQASVHKIVVSHGIANGGPVGEVKIKDAAITELREALGNLPHTKEVVARVDASYYAGTTLGVAFRSFLRSILDRFGLLYLDPLAPAIRTLAAPFLRNTVGRIPDLLPELRERNKQLAEAGYHAQVHVDQDTSLVFLMKEGKRVALRYRNGQFTGKDHQYSVDELRDLSFTLSPNALLRPVMQDYLLPTISYVGGPSEIAYMAQAEVLYRHLLGRMPIIFPRNSYTLLDAKASKLLQKYQLRVMDLFGSREQVQSRISAKLVPTSLAEEFQSAKSVFDATMGKLRSQLAAFDPTLEQAAGKSAAKIQYQLQKMSRKVAGEIMRRDEYAARNTEYLTNYIYPHRHLQERFYSIVPFLAKYGLNFPQRLLEEAQLVCPDHLVRTI